MTINDYYYRINKFLPRASESGSHPYYLKWKAYILIMKMSLWMESSQIWDGVDLVPCIVAEVSWSFWELGKPT
jgi:hypothetical protein